jgi:hypothetical protein
LGCTISLQAAVHPGALATGTQHKKNVKDVVEGRLNGLAVELYDEYIQKLVTGFDKCLNVDGGCVEK